MKTDKLGRFTATGKRKMAVARVRMKPGTGTILVNGYGGYSLTQVPQGSVLEFTANFDGTAGSMFTNIGLSSTTATAILDDHH